MKGNLQVIVFFHQKLPHEKMKHSISSRSSPTQCFPSPKGKGLLHFLVLDRVPIPQVLEHKEYDPQDPHCPSTAIKYVSKLYSNIIDDGWPEFKYLSKCSVVYLKYLLQDNQSYNHPGGNEELLIQVWLNTRIRRNKGSATNSRCPQRSCYIIFSHRGL